MRTKRTTVVPYNAHVTTRKQTPGKKPKTLNVDASQAARLAVNVASDRQASDIILLNVAAVSGFADYMVIMSVTSARQLSAVALELEEAIEQAGLKIHHREGTGESGWILLDFGDVVLHVFSETQREYYKLERVWETAKQVVRIQ